ncbi:hypothetical protein D5018_13730 [Parashewanella curva]|uniref:Uncharacterized protein n=1 Tax=Parashewanella curva TaxID=2338552 RepID=A0A3L8PWF6_9GAMM|nr:hypothetical protein [Parashewanella curva]RLV59129.1 hypothetical protein D5018_13730 [Parashewanella curva]
MAHAVQPETPPSNSYASALINNSQITTQTPSEKFFEMIYKKIQVCFHQSQLKEVKRLITELTDIQRLKINEPYTIICQMSAIHNLRLLARPNEQNKFIVEFEHNEESCQLTFSYRIENITDGIVVELPTLKSSVSNRTYFCVTFDYKQLSDPISHSAPSELFLTQLDGLIAFSANIHCSQESNVPVIDRDCLLGWQEAMEQIYNLKENYLKEQKMLQDYERQKLEKHHQQNPQHYSQPTATKTTKVKVSEVQPSTQATRATFDQQATSTIARRNSETASSSSKQIPKGLTKFYFGKLEELSFKDLEYVHLRFKCYLRQKTNASQLVIKTFLGTLEGNTKRTCIIILQDFNNLISEHPKSSWAMSRLLINFLKGFLSSEETREYCISHNPLEIAKWLSEIEEKEKKFIPASKLS